MAAVNVGVAHSNQWNFLQHSEGLDGIAWWDLARQAISSGPPAPQNVAKSSIALNGPPQRLPLPLATGFVLLIHIFHIIPQVVRSFNVTDSL